jgi:hypothetical protein
MAFLLQQCVRVCTACVLVTIFAVPPNLLAQAHVISPAELQKETVAASRARQRNLDTLTNFLSSAKAQAALKSAGINTQQVKTAVSALDNQELAKLAARADKAQADFAAGNITDHDLLIIMVAILALVLIIVAVHH